MKPHFGHTKTGHAVHLRTLDHLKPPDSAPWWDKANAWLAVKVTRGVGTMWCAYAFAVLALLGLPSALHPGGEGIIAWIAQTFLQLVLLSIIIVGQSVQATASDARAAKTFEDVEIVTDRLDTATQGGLTEVLDAVRALTARVDRLASGETGERLKGG